MGLIVGLSGCHHPTISAVSLNPEPCGPECGSFWGVMHHCLKSKEEGIPFYLPKPLLIVAKNFRNIEDAKVGLTDSAPIPNVFDDQGKYADLNARASFNFGDSSAASPAPAPASGKAGTQAADPAAPAPPAANNTLPASTATKSGAYTYSQNAPNVTPHDVPSDGLAPNTFFTYHIVFIPDLTQKYGLKVSGGVGEIRAAMNLVNGWQFTGLGPYYMKDSSTAQDVMASGIAARLGGQAVQDVLKGVAGLAGGGKLQGGDVSASAPPVQELARAIGELPRDRFPLMSLPNYAEIHVYEPRLGPDGQMEWNEIANLSFNRDYIGGNKTTVKFQPPTASQSPGANPANPLARVQAGDPNATPLGGGQVQVGLMDADLTKRAVATALGIPPDSQALQTGALQTGTVQTGVLQAGVLQAGVPVTAARTKPSVLGGLFHHDKTRGSSVSRVINDLAPAATNANNPTIPAVPGTPAAPAGGAPVSTGNTPAVRTPSAPTPVPAAPSPGIVAPRVGP
jgi:hypothetical protein